MKNKITSAHPVLLFSLLRYLRYILQMLRGIIIAKYLGPYYLGVWGFVTLAVQYLSYTSFGIENGITVLLSTEDGDTEQQTKYTSSALIGVVISGLLVLGTGLVLFFSGTELFPKFEFNHYLLLILAATILTNLQQVFINIFRVKKTLAKIAIVEITSALILLGIALIVRSEKVITAQLWGMVFSSLLGIIILAARYPFKIRLKFGKTTFKNLMKVSFPLFIYNLSFYLILVAPRTVLSFYYSLEELGHYTLANSIATAALLGFRSIAWAIYPEVLARLRPGVKLETARKNISQINRLYSTAVFLTLFFCILLMPLLVLYLPQYRPSLPSITILLLAQGILAVSFGYNSLAVSRKQQKEVARIGILVTLTVTLISLLVSIVRLDYLYISLTILGGALLYTWLNIRLGLNILEIRQNRVMEYAELLSGGCILALLLFTMGVFTVYAFWFNLAGLLVFLVSNRQELLFTWEFVKEKAGFGKTGKK